MSLSKLTALIIFMLLITQSFARDSVKPLIDGVAYTKPTRLIEVEPGRRLNLYCIGKGTPVVIFESGLTEPINNWGLVQPTVAKTTMACSYDRAGVGFSDPISRPSTSVNIVNDLYKMLKIANIEPPYVMVGHSTGGLSARLYAHTYPDEVVGMVLVDPSDENQVSESRKLYPEQTDEQWQSGIDEFLQTQRVCMNAAQKGFVPGSEQANKCQLDQYEQLSLTVQKATNSFQMKYPFWQAQVSELENFYTTSAKQLRKVRKSFGDMPLIVLTESRTPPQNVSQGEFELWKSSYDLWKSFHIEQAKLSTRGIQKIIHGSGHHIQLDKPEAVEEAIVQILKMLSVGQ